MRNSTFSYPTKKSGRNKYVLRCDLNVPMLHDLWMARQVCSTLLAQQKRNDIPLFWYVTSLLSASQSQQISVHGVAGIAPMYRADSLGDRTSIFLAQGGDFERIVASDGKPMQITKEIDDVLLMCGYVADDLSKLVLDSLQLVEQLLSGTM